MKSIALRLVSAALSTALLVGCATTAGPYGHPGDPLERLGDEIVACGQLYHTGAPVVLWTDPGGYDAYRAECRFTPDQLAPKNPVSDSPVRYSTYRRHLPEDVADRVRTQGWSLPLLQEWVDLFVLHYDVCGTSRRCFRVLQDMRGLSVHFMLDVDGTIYQTLDLKERAWHAGSGNDRSVGIEIANIGAYPDMDTLERWYAQDEHGRTFLTLPERMGDGGVRTPDFTARPARNDPVSGSVQDQDLLQYDLTEEQYDSLIKLTATLCTVLPGIALDYPRDKDGRLRTTKLTDEELNDFSGIIGHYHLTTRKIDPGPALDWDRLIDDARMEMD
ncbi:MAG: N-acetylmuramoyl-L-alanine amidase [bacterium]|nr:N-acetylmuramoyl-L-alanine amidase [bacterium]